MLPIPVHSSASQHWIFELLPSIFNFKILSLHINIFDEDNQVFQITLEIFIQQVSFLIKLPHKI